LSATIGGVDDELLDCAKRSIAREHGLAERNAHRLVGDTAAELHADAKAMAKEAGPMTRPSGPATRAATTAAARIRP